MNNKVTNHPKHYFLNRMSLSDVLGRVHREFSEDWSAVRARRCSMAELFDDPKWEGGMGATTIAWCNLWDRVASETGLSEEALMQCNYSPLCDAVTRV